jgi:hypothetical protein
MQAGLRTVFDSSAAQFDLLIPVLVPLGALIVTMWLYKTGTKRLYWKIGVGITILFIAVALVFPYLDYRRVKDRLASGAVETKEGLVSGHRRWTERRFTGSTKGVGVTSTHHYTTTTYETFYVGDRFFSFIAGGYPSGASFTNAADPPVIIKDGMRARATYFIDDWNDDGLRIVRLELGPGDGTPVAAMPQAVVPASGQSAEGGGGALPSDFAAFRARFGTAVAKGDAAATKAMVNFPFLFGGHTLEADEFDSLWMSLFSEPLRPCLATAKPVAEGDRYTLLCGPYGYYFGRTKAGWKLIEFGADGEAM